jgi:putative transposase
MTPTTLLRWYQRLVAKRWTYPRQVGRSAIRGKVRDVVLRQARENPRWGYQRIVGELKVLVSRCRRPSCAHGCGHVASGPSALGGVTWREFVRAHRDSMFAVDFFTVVTICNIELSNTRAGPDSTVRNMT